MGYLTKEIIASYKDKLERGIAEYMGMPAGERSANGVRGMLECWSVVDAAEQSLCGGGAFAADGRRNDERERGSADDDECVLYGKSHGMRTKPHAHGIDAP